jgi:hypothetical protein
MNESIKAIAGIFTGKGGTIRLAIAGSLVSAIIYEIIDSKYDFRAKTSGGASISLTPASERSASTMADNNSGSDESTITDAQENMSVSDTPEQTNKDND